MIGAGGVRSPRISDAPVQVALNHFETALDARELGV